MNESSVRPRPEPRAVDAKQGMVINCAAYHGGCRVADIDLDQAREVDSSDGRFVWIGLHEPDQPLLRTVQQRFGLHDLAIEDALRARQRPKLEIYGNSLFIVLRTTSLHLRNSAGSPSPAAIAFRAARQAARNRPQASRFRPESVARHVGPDLSSV